jgi:hypothetical protein
MRTFLPSKCSEDRGSTMIAVLMVVAVVSVVAITSVQIAQHSSDVTSVDRERLQTVSAADAGVTDAIGRIEHGAGCDAAASPFADLKDGSKVVGRFRTRIDPEAGTTCGQTPRRLIHAWGYAPTGGARALRHLEVTVELVPQAGFPFTLFAEGSAGTIYVKNSGTITGDAYSEVFDQSKNNLTARTVITPGSIVTKNNVSYSGTLWAGGNVTIGNNGSIGQSIIATGTAPGSQGNIVLNANTVVGGDARAKGTVTLGSGAVVQGSISQNNLNLTPPPVLTKPTFDPSAITYDVQGTAAAITTALDTNRNNLQGEYRSTDGGTIVFPDDVTATGPLTIVATGKVAMGRTMSVSGGPFTVVIVAQSTAADAIDVPKSLTIASGLHALLFTQGGVDMKNAVTMTGAIYADTIDAKNTFTVTRSDLLANSAPVGFTWSFGSSASFHAVPTLWREILPGEPPP